MTDLAIVESKPFHITLTGLQVTGKPTFEQWLQQGRELWYAKQSISWCLGDWLNYGEHAYGQKYTQAISETDYTLQTLMNYAYTAKAIDPTARRENVSFSNHSEVASLNPVQQKQALDNLESGAWNRDQVRAYKRSLKAQPDVIEQTVTLQFTQMQVSDGRLIVVFVPPQGEIVEFRAIVRKVAALEKSA